MLTVREVADMTEGTLLCGSADTVVTNVCCDSREVREGTLFVPIRGEKVDAHLFIESCVEKGAATLTEFPAPPDAVKPYIQVSDTRSALQALAAAYRNRSRAVLIGVTGSVGKTSTKEMIAAALSKGLCVMKTQGNKNSQIGLPLTMFDIKAEHEAAVIEMGMSEFGEMDRLADIARPDMAVMTNIGTAHIENLGSQQNILSEKFRIAKHFTKDSILFLNGDDPLLKTLHGKQPFRTVTFGLGTDNDYHAEHIRTEGYHTRFICQGKEWEIPALGEHSVRNALAALAVGKALGLEDTVIQEGLLTYRNAPMRQQFHELPDGVLLMDDSYNASPEAVKVSLDVLKSVAKGRTTAVLADMLELGEQSAALHYAVGKHLAEIGIHRLLAVGALSEHTAQGAVENGCSEVYHFTNNREAYESLSASIEPQEAILVKGSRGMHTEEIVKQLLSERT